MKADETISIQIFELTDTYLCIETLIFGEDNPEMSEEDKEICFIKDKVYRPISTTHFMNESEERHGFTIEGFKKWFKKINV